MTERARLARGDSAEQRAAEIVMLSVLAAELGLTFGPGKRVMPDGTRVELDAISDEPRSSSRHGRTRDLRSRHRSTRS